jgi:FKBP-type peptidyl-prolyl cis-trans isomerase FkpA
MRNLQKFSFYGTLVLLALLSGSCKKTLSDSELMDNEQAKLKQYLNSHNITIQPTASGLYYLPTDTGTGIKPDAADIVEFTYSLRLVNDQVIATNIDSVARKYGIYTGGVFYTPFKYRLSWWFVGLREGFQLMREGGKATFIIPSNLAYGKNGSPYLNIGSYTTVIFDISLIRVIHDPIADEKALIEKYVLDSIPPDKPTDINDSGVYHIIDVAGTGDVPVNGKTVSFRYTAKFLDGTIIDKIEPDAIPFNYTLGLQQVVLPGIDQVIRKMKNGESAWAIIPYKQAYGEQPNVNLPPFATLVYYINIVAIN